MEKWCVFDMGFPLEATYIKPAVHCNFSVFSNYCLLDYIRNEPNEILGEITKWQNYGQNRSEHGA